MKTEKQQAINDMVLARCEYVLYLRERGMTYQAIADRLGVTRENVRQRLNRAMRERRKTVRSLKDMVPTVQAVSELVNH